MDVGNGNVDPPEGTNERVRLPKSPSSLVNAFLKKLLLMFLGNL